MTVVFGRYVCACVRCRKTLILMRCSLTSAFTAYGTATISGTAAEIASAKAALFHTVNSDVLLLVYIGIGMWASTFIYMSSFVYSCVHQVSRGRERLLMRAPRRGESATRRIRERYLRSILRQNVAYFDKLGAGEVTTRIQTDTVCSLSPVDVFLH